MDIVLNQFEATTISSKESDESITNYDGYYKNWGKLGSQNTRRQEILVSQKSNRNQNLDETRGIVDLVKAVQEEQIFKTHNKKYYKPSRNVPGFTQTTSFGNVLMISEWLTEKPSDFEENWLVVPAPKGTRTLIVASHGCTRLFSKYGHFLFECCTALPGGNPNDYRGMSKCCVLDGFLQKKDKKLYILDILAWNSQPMTDGELEFRDYWLKSQFLELDDIRVITKKNQLALYLLPKESCEKNSFNNFMMKMPYNFDVVTLDGLLFYHKKGHYLAGMTPLVGWLYPYMVQEILGCDITVNQKYLIQKPDNYKNQALFIINFERKMDSKKSQSRQTKLLHMMDASYENQMQNCQSPNTETMDADVPESIDKAALLMNTMTLPAESMDADDVIVSKNKKKASKQETKLH